MIQKIKLFFSSRVEGVKSPIGENPDAVTSPFAVFLTPEAAAINRARQSHLDSLCLDLRNKRVLELGAGIGLHTQFFLERGCEVVMTDGNSENVAEARRRLPANVQVEKFDLENDGDWLKFGKFDLIYCYGLLYHLGNPSIAITNMAKICTGQLLLETGVGLGRFSELQLIRDFFSNNQATSGIGCRPTRLWIMEQLSANFGHAYVSRTQPDYPDFTPDWVIPDTRLIYRAIFVGSKSALSSSELLTDLPDHQPTYRLS